MCTEVARCGHLETGAEAVPLGGEDDRFLNRLELVVEKMVAPIVPAEVPSRVEVLRLGVAGTVPGTASQVDAGGEIRARGRDHHATEVVAIGQRVGRLPQRRGHLRVDRVELLRSLECHGDDPIILSDGRIALLAHR
jgi:hypothetical protein